MTMPAPPPDTRAAGQSGHIADHNTISDALTALEAAVGTLQSSQASPVFYVNGYGADPSGMADSTPAVVAAAAAATAAVAAGTPQALVAFGRGSYKVTGGNIATTGAVGFTGPGAGACTILGQGSGKIFARTNTTAPTAYGEQAPVSGMTIDGTGCGSSAAYGLYDTDIGHALYQDLNFQNFTGSGSRGLVQYLASYWAEQVLGWRLWFQNCTIGHLQDGGTAPLPSFDYSDFYGLHYNLYPGQTGRQLQGNAPVVGGSYRAHVNCHAQSGGAFQAVWQIGSSGADTSSVTRCNLDIAGEVDGSGSTCYDFQIGAGAGLYGFGNVQLPGFTANPGSGTGILVGSISAPSFSRNIMNLVPVGAGPGTAFGGWTTSTYSYALRLPISGGSPSQGGSISSGNGAPTTTGNQGDLYVRLDTPTVANQRLYMNTSSGSGTTWTGIV